MITQRIVFTRTPTAQTGAALVVAMVFLIGMTVLGLAAMGGNSLQQRMTYATAENNYAFQSAETALTDGENWLDSRNSRPAADCPTTNAAACGNSTSVWPGRPVGTAPEVDATNLATPSWWLNHGRKAGWTYQDGAAPAVNQSILVGTSTPPSGSARYPRYVIEELGKDPSGSLVVGGAPTFTLWYYQVTGRGTGYQDFPATLSQSVYTRGF